MSRILIWFMSVAVASTAYVANSAAQSTPEAPESVFDELDVDADDSLTLEEFLGVDLGTSARFGPGQGRAIRGNRETRFECMDADADGLVSRTEFMETAGVRQQSRTTRSNRGARGRCAQASPEPPKRWNRTSPGAVDNQGKSR